MRSVLFAVLADIHANYQALEAVAADAQEVCQRLQAKELHYIVLGDVVDYGPQPNQCMEWVDRNAEIVVQGNHDLDVADSLYRIPSSISPKFWPITLWTRVVLEPKYKRILEQWQAQRCCAQLPSVLKNFVLFHSSLTRLNGRIDDDSVAYEDIQHMKKLGEDTIYGLFGHTHIQGYFVDDMLRKRDEEDETTTPYLIFPEDFDLEGVGHSDHWEAVSLESDSKSSASNVGQTPWTELPSQPTLFNPGGLGQPRPSGPTRLAVTPDNRASYMLMKSNGRIDFQFRRVPYDYRETIRRLREEVKWPPAPYRRHLGSDILKEVQGPNPYPRDAWVTLMRDYRKILHEAPKLLPDLIENVLVPQLR